VKRQLHPHFYTKWRGSKFYMKTHKLSLTIEE
jgi:hypothetical protein